jgi:hypothetical protein
MAHKITIEFSTSVYRFNHGAEPRGRGGWAFALNPNGMNDDAYWAKDAAGFGSLTFGEAKKAARRHFTRQARDAAGFNRDAVFQALTVHVLP